MASFTKMTETCMFGLISEEYKEDFCECVISMVGFAPNIQDEHNTYTYRLSGEEHRNLSQVWFEGEVYTDYKNVLMHVIKKFVEEHATTTADNQRHIFILNRDFVVGDDPEIKIMNDGHDKHDKYFYIFWIKNLSLMDN